MTTPIEPQGDYGYDLAHEGLGAAKEPESRAADEPRRPAPDRRPDPREDYGYDEAHSF